MLEQKQSREQKQCKGHYPLARGALHAGACKGHHPLLRARFTWEQKPDGGSEPSRMWRASGFDAFFALEIGNR